MTTYATPRDGLPGQMALHTQRATFTDAYCVIPRGVMTDIVTSYLPGWTDTRLWIIARPLSGFSETFSQYIMEVMPGGGTDAGEPDPEAEGVIFIVDGRLTLTLPDGPHDMAEGGYAYIPPGTPWSLRATGQRAAKFHWIRKIYEPAPGVAMPDAFVTNEQHFSPSGMPGTNMKWATTRFVQPLDLRHDMHVNIVTLEPGASIPFEETHVHEHGLYVLQGKAVYKLNNDWVEVESGDFMWLRSFCPQACYAGGTERFRYLLYKDVNRHAKLRGVLGR